MAIRILIVEDDESTRELIREYLAQDSRLEVVAEVEDGGEAVTLAKKYHPDVVLMDLMLQGMDGLKATKLIKKACPKSEIIILTNLEFEDMRDRYPVWAFLFKREIPKRLLAVISALIRSKGDQTQSRNV